MIRGEWVVHGPWSEILHVYFGKMLGGDGTWYMVHVPITPITKLKMLGGYGSITSIIKFEMLGGYRQLEINFIGRLTC